MTGSGPLWWLLRRENWGSQAPQRSHSLCRKQCCFQIKSSFLAWGTDKHAAADPHCGNQAGILDVLPRPGPGARGQSKALIHRPRLRAQRHPP